MKILVIENNKDILVNILDYLSMKGYSVDCAQDGITGLHLAVKENYDLIVLDVMLPGIDGIKLCHSLREEAKKNTPIIMLTARDSIPDRVQGLKAGADDYLVKPFALIELITRIETIIRRSQGNNNYILQVADLSYNLDTLEVQRAGIAIKLNPTAQKILEILMKKSPNVVRREYIEEQLWGENYPDSDSLRSHIHQLRQSIDKPFETALLHTVHKVGYRLMDNATNEA